MTDETPYAFVQRRRAEGASLDALRAELEGRGLDTADVALLLGQPVYGAATGAGAPAVAAAGPAAPAEGTPWALVQQLRAEGYPREAIARELAARGIAKEDADALLVDEPLSGALVSAGQGGGVPVNLIFGLLMVVAGVLILFSGRIGALPIVLIAGGLGRAATAFKGTGGGAALEAQAQQAMQPLARDSTRARCAVHGDYASIGTCPRCGSFCCAMCTPGRGFEVAGGCMKCLALPELRADRAKKAARQAALWLLSGPACAALILTLDTAFSTDGPGALAVLVLTAVVSTPWLVLALVQALVHRQWPALLSSVPWLAVMVFLLANGAGVLMVALWLIPAVGAVVGAMGLRAAQEQPRPLASPASLPLPATNL